MLLPVLPFALAASFGDPDPTALAALRLLGADVAGTETRCQECHTPNIFTLNRWAQQTWEARWMCLYESDDDRTALPPRDQIDCLRSDPDDVDAPFAPDRLGIYTAGAHLPYFENLFKAAFPQNEWAQRYARFKSEVSMPNDGRHLLLEADFDLLLKWTHDGMPSMEKILGRPGNPPTECKNETTPELTAHLAAMAQTGWKAKNREAGLRMFACSEGQPASACFAQARDGNALFPESRDTDLGRTWAQDFPESKIRFLRELPFSTSYWMRASPDGRFIANGYNPPGVAGGGDGNGNDDRDPTVIGDGFEGIISDLETQLTGAAFRDIKVAALYDPSFFPDQSGFMFQGTPGGAGFCRHGLLEDPATTKITWKEPGCSESPDVWLYQSVGGSLDGGDYLTAAGEFAGDSGSGRAGGDGPTHWFEKAYLQLVPVINDGERFQTLPPVTLWTPFLADYQMAPSTELIASRVSGLGANGRPAQMGYAFHLISKERVDGGYVFETKRVGTVCEKGGKGGFSYDERFYTFYHYAAPSDWAELGFATPNEPVFLEMLRQGVANLYVSDLKTGVTRRVTRMAAGQFALFPHFRSDGWLYALVYDKASKRRFAVATDAALVMEAAAAP